MKIGYARVSTADQNLDLQREALRKAGCDRIFEEKKSGKAGTHRPSSKRHCRSFGLTTCLWCGSSTGSAGPDRNDADNRRTAA